MHIRYCTGDQFLAQTWVAADVWSAVASPPVYLVVVDLQEGARGHEQELAGRLPICPVIGINSVAGDSQVPGFIDVVAESQEALACLRESVCANPRAAALLVQLLRQTLSLSVEQGLLAESLAYSSLQHGAEFERNLAGLTKSANLDDSEPAVVTERFGNLLRLRLNRPAKRNAYSAGMRDALCEALQLARLDTTIEQVVLAGAGDAFCAGADLSEFGLAPDATVAHLSRSTRSAGVLLHELAPRVSAQVHGACIGAGIELPAFASHIVAEPNSFFQLPEVGMGLVPGAGGTVSLPRRIGRRRTAWLALSGQRIDAKTALAWGLVDELAFSSPGSG